MLNPDTRHLLTDALRPPTGHRLDAAVATTYTLDLASLLLAPLSMAAYDQSEEGIDGASPHELLEAIRRYADRTTVFCQAGGIHAPSTSRKLTVFAEDSVLEVTPPAGRVFHPKIWVLRFIDSTDALTHRFVCLSRNLTADRSWDTVLMLEEDAAAEHQVAAAPAATFLTDLLAMTTRSTSQPRATLIRGLASSLRDRAFAVPAPFTKAELIPFGTPSGGGWPVPDHADRVLAVSPFLDKATVQRLPEGTTLVSRGETLDRLGATALDGLDLRVLLPHADAPPDAPEDEELADESKTRGLEIKTGLHAKVLAWDRGKVGSVLTGSANATSAAFDGNIEFGALLSGPVARCGAATILKEDDNETGFVRLLQPHSASAEPVPDPEFELEKELEEFHVALAGSSPTVTVSADDDAHRLRLSWATLPKPPASSQSWARPITMTNTADRPLTDDRGWPGLGHTDLTPFVAVRTRVERGDLLVERSCVVRADLLGAPEDRARRVLQELLSKVEDVLRYLALLLRDPSIDDVASGLMQTANEKDGSSWNVHGWMDDLVLVEPLVRAFARGDEALERVQSLLVDLRDDNGRLPDLGPDTDAQWQEFEALWQVVTAAREAR